MGKGAVIDKSHIEDKGDNHSNFVLALKENGFEAITESENEGNIQKFRLTKDGAELSYRKVLELWERDEGFIDFYLSLLKKCGFQSFLWEVRPVSIATIDQPFEFVLHSIPRTGYNPDYDTFRAYFNTTTPNHGVVVFPNLGHDAILVVPSPFRKKANYSGFADFLRESPVYQQRALWKVTAHQIRLNLSDEPTWISVAGGGIAWLHIRLDSKPKYYRYAPYTRICS